MKFSRVCRLGCQLLAVGLALFGTISVSEGKNIRLRNETIDTDSGANRAVMAGQKSLHAAASGLFLVQFNGPLEPAQRDELKKSGVELIKYVPDDAFIVKLEKISPATVSALSFVRWVGPYKSEHKIHPQLAPLAQNAAQSNATVSVNILLSPNASA
ncbi:MAG: hypothetical protein RL616_1841, partial [Verrucomicrobiota bacterium]